MKKKVIIMKNEKKFGAENVGWATAQLYCKGWRYCIVRKKKILYCEIVLQGRLENSGKLYCNTLECIVIEPAGLAQRLYRNTV